MTQVAQLRTSGGSIPPLASGDHLTLEEFDARWDGHPEIKKAELIDGMVFVEMTVGREHGRTHAEVVEWLRAFARKQGGLEVLDNTTVRLGPANSVQPDVLVRRTEGGSSVITAGDLVSGPPELVFEVADSSAAYDLNMKKRLYEQAGIQEYAVWQVHDRRIDWWELRDGQYVPLPLSDEGVFESRTFPGLRLAALKMLEGDTDAVLAAAQAPE